MILAEEFGYKKAQQEIDRLKDDNDKLKKALQIYADDDVIGTVARKALKGGE